MDSRRDFIKKAAMLAGSTGLFSVLPPSIQKALAIDPQPGSTWMDAEHVVILMQENRSFDHCYGALRGVRGRKDPRAITLPNGNPVFLQTNKKGETYAPFRLDIKDTKATWMGSLPHSWANQTDARNEGKYDQWLQAKPSGHKDYAEMPLTLGYYDRRDIPFYYSLADAFTICDQNFCSSLTGTTPNRLYLWTGTIREDGQHRARVRNNETDYPTTAAWTTFPERLEDAGIDWRIYQNEVSVFDGFKGEEDGWLSNFTDNPIEWFDQYNVRFADAYIKALPEMIAARKTAVSELEARIAALPAGDKELPHLRQALAEKQAEVKFMSEDLVTKTPENFAKLSQREQNLHRKAFMTNSGDPAFHELTTLRYHDGSEEREVKVPKGDVLHQFRSDVREGKLPTVSWLVAPENFSDHPGAPWYGAWYVSEVLDILTQDEALWKKTIFILCYDENDGYFDHVPPFVAPDPARPETGKVSEGIDPAMDYVTLKQDMEQASRDDARSGPIGLGYRVPLVIASPWSRGGFVNSQVFDHTSILQFLEKFVQQKTGKTVQETNITQWRRTVCGDLSSVFRPYNGEKYSLPAFLGQQEVVEGIHKARFKQLPGGYRRLSDAEVTAFRKDPYQGTLMEQPEKGIRPSCALPYELFADINPDAAGRNLVVTLGAGRDMFGAQAAGAPFAVYIYGREMKVRNYAVKAGDKLQDEISLDEFRDGHVDIQIHGPNGFFRQLAGPAKDLRPGQDLVFDQERNSGGKMTGRLIISGGKVKVTDHYKNIAGAHAAKVDGGPQQTFVDPTANGGWYDLSITLAGRDSILKRFAGRVETGRDGHSDPAMA